MQKQKKMLMGEVICENKRNFSSASPKKKLLEQFPFFPSFDEKNSFLLKQLAKEFCRYFYVRRLELQVKQEHSEEAKKNPSINYRIIFTLSIKLI